MKLIGTCSLALLISILACLDPRAAFETSRNTGNPLQATNSLKIIALDVGQGDATLVLGPDGRVGLIDAGPPGAGLTKILPVLRSMGIDSLTWVLISHYDADHLGGLLEVLRGEDQAWDTDDDIHLFDSVWDRGGNKLESTPWFEEYARELGMADYRRTISVGHTFELGHGAQAKVILVKGRYNDGTLIHLNADEENESSLAVLIEYDNFRYLSAGDLSGGGFSGTNETKDLETKLAQLTGAVDIVHLNHHGSRTSSNENFLDRLQPDAAIASVGVDNDHNHPHPEIIERLNERNINLFRTDTGTITISSDGESYSIQSFSSSN